MESQKIEAIYDLRAAVEVKARAEQALAASPSPGARDALLDATLDVEAKTQHAIEVCHECGHPHRAGDPHAVRERLAGGGNVIDVDFGGASPQGAG